MPTVRIPLAQPIETRDGSLSKDSKCVNGYFETRDQKREFIKRPGVQLMNTTVPTGNPQGMIYFQGYLYVAVDNKVYKVSPTTYSTVLIGTMTGALANCYMTPSYNGSYIFIQNQTNGYLFNLNTSVFSQIDATSLATVTIIVGGSGYTTGDTVVFSAPSTFGGVTATGTLQVTAGAVTGVTITNPGTGYTSPPTMSVTTGSGVGLSTSCLLNYFPSSLTPGVAAIDGYIIVSTPAGRLYSSNVGDPTLWNALDYVTAEADPDQTVGICKHLNYVISFGTQSTQFFYDSGAAVASPLAPAQAYTMEIGCTNGDSVVAFEQTVIWIGSSRIGGTAIYLLDGTNPQRISTSYVERILGNSSCQLVTAYTFKMNGHGFYVLTLHDINVTIVYDMLEKIWVQWTMWSPDPYTGVYGENYYRPVFAVGNENNVYAVDHDNARMYNVLDNFYTDNLQPIYYRAVTDLNDSGTTKRKFFNRLEIIGDKLAGVMKVRHTGDDYNTWSTYRSVDLNKSRSQMYQTGSDRRRAWEFLSIDSVPLRIDSAEIDFDIGELENQGVQPTKYR